MCWPGEHLFIFFFFFLLPVFTGSDPLVSSVRPRGQLHLHAGLHHRLEILLDVRKARIPLAVGVHSMS